MSNKHKREKFLRVVKQNLTKVEIGEFEKKEPPVSYSKIEQDKLVAFAERFVLSSRYSSIYPLDALR